MYNKSLTNSLTSLNKSPICLKQVSIWKEGRRTDTLKYLLVISYFNIGGGDRHTTNVIFTISFKHGRGDGNT